MAATLKSKLNSGREPAPPAYDYEDLETKFDIHKYYPKYFHNYNYSTPVIKDMIADKPIYADANKHNKAWKNPGARQTVSRTIDLDTGNITTKPVGAKEFKRAIKNERKSLHKDHRHEKRELRRDQRHERKAIRKEHHQELPDIERQPKADAEHDDIVLFKSWDNPLAAPQPVRRSDGRYPSDISGSAVLHYNHHKTNEPLRFNDPFDSTASTLVPHESTNSRTKTKTHSIAHTFKNLMKIEHHHEHNNSDSTSSRRSSVTANKLAPSSSYDQTKSSMTTSRTMSLLKKMTGSDRRNSEAPVEIVTETVNNGRTGEQETIQYTQSQMVGHGSFGVVFQTQLIPSNEIAAIKRVLQDKRFKNRELQIMKLVHHRNIVDLKHYFYTNNEKNELYLNLILEFVPETLYKASHYYVSKRLSMPSLEVKLYTYQMLRALNYIHSQGICHRDIKPQNLLIDPSTGVLKLCDFGSAKILNPSEANVSYICSRYYRAPELIFGATNYTTKIDVWSAGCVMAELILGQPLFPGESGIDQLVEIIKILGTPSRDQIKNMNPNYIEYTFPQIKPIPLSKIFRKMASDCIQFLSKVLQYSPIERISCIEALCDPYFDELRNSETKLPNYRKLFSHQQSHNYNSYTSTGMNGSSSSGSNNGNGYSSNANYQLYESQPDSRPLPELFDFDDRELSVAPALNHKLVPSFAFDRLKLRSGKQTLAEFVPMTESELEVSLE